MKLFKKPKVVSKFTLTWYHGGMHYVSENDKELDMNYGSFSLGNEWVGGRLMLEELGELAYLGDKIKVTMEIIK